MILTHVHDLMTIAEQGFHDVVSIFLLVLEEDHLAFALSEAMSLRHLSDYMNRDFDVVSQSMRLVLVLVRAADEELHAFLKRARVEPFFATSWLITWFAHDVKSVDEVARIYDALLASHPMMCFYLCAAVCTLHRILHTYLYDAHITLSFFLRASAVCGAPARRSVWLRL